MNADWPAIRGLLLEFERPISHAQMRTTLGDQCCCNRHLAGTLRWAEALGLIEWADSGWRLTAVGAVP